MNKKIITEFRKDIVSGDWILVSTLRQFRPMPKDGRVSLKTPLSKCPFEDPQKSGNPMPILWYPKPAASKKGKNKKSYKLQATNYKLDDWFIQVIPNKYPLLLKDNACSTGEKYGPLEKIDGLGFHEVIITRDHDKDLKKMSLDEIGLVLKTYQDRYLMIEKDKCVEYVLIFHNQGPLAGASVEHPHSQLVALPIVPPDVSKSINGGIAFFEKNKKCVHCVMLEWEKKEKKRVIYENEHFVTIAPYASRVPYEARIFPKAHSSDFEETSEELNIALAESLKDALHRIAKVLKNPDYNFFIHTASAKVKNVPYYHWHIEILPRTYKWAGLELGTGIEVLSISPEQAAEDLRKAEK